MEVKVAEETCKKLKESIDFVNTEVARLNGQKSIVNERLQEINKSCSALGIKPEELDSVIKQGEDKLDEIIQEAQGIIDKINELRG